MALSSVPKIKGNEPIVVSNTYHYFRLCELLSQAKGKAEIGNILQELKTCFVSDAQNPQIAIHGQSVRNGWVQISKYLLQNATAVQTICAEDWKSLTSTEKATHPITGRPVSVVYLNGWEDQPIVGRVPVLISIYFAKPDHPDFHVDKTGTTGIIRIEMEPTTLLARSFGHITGLFALT
jgi:hypothetical protein